MPRPKKRKQPRPCQAAKDLEKFVEDNRISLRDAAAALGVTHQALLSWFSGVSKPKNELRKVIAVWTKEAVPESAWMTQVERDALDKIKPFEPKDGKDAA